MNIGAIVQARMSSQRLPGKMLRRVLGRPLIEYVVRRAAACPAIDRVVVATSVQSEDDPLASYCEGSGLDCFRGPLEDLAARFVGALTTHSFDAFFRVNGDCPWLDGMLLDRAARVFREERLDLVTNLAPRSYPYGISVELVDAGVFLEAAPRMASETHREHVTAYLYDHLSDFRYRNLAMPGGMDFSGTTLTVDTEADMRRFEREMAVAGERWREWTFRDVLGIREDADAGNKEHSWSAQGEEI